MGEYRAEVVNSETAGYVAIEVFRTGDDALFHRVQEPMPENFPPECAQHLADFMRRGYLAACKRFDPSGAWSSRGRPTDQVVQEVGRQGAELKKAHPELTWGQIALKVCPQRQEPGHDCDKLCSDRIYQAAKPHMRPQQ